MTSGDEPQLGGQHTDPISGSEPAFWGGIVPNCHVVIRVAWRASNLSRQAFVDHSIEEGHIYFDDKGACLLFKESIRLPRNGIYDIELRVFEEHWDIYTKLRAIQRHFTIALRHFEGSDDIVPIKRLLLWQILNQHLYMNRAGITMRRE